jgi:glycosyltransferase involved in cell wall biosynthesis
MSDKIIGIMWNKNEGDILDETITKALPLVDHLLVADDDSDDNSWDVIREHKSELAYISRYSEATNKQHSKNSWQRNSLLDKAKEIYGTDIWIQVIESDLIAIDTDIWEQVETRNNLYGIGIWWVNIEAVRKQWLPEDEMYPNWDRSIQEVMDWGHILEKAPYTWRPYPGVYFPERWAPFPNGLVEHGAPGGEWRVRKRFCREDSPLWGHYNIRGRKHFEKRYANVPLDAKSRARREIVSFTVPQNPDYTPNLFRLNRESWVNQYKHARGRVFRSLW